MGSAEKRGKLLHQLLITLSTSDIIGSIAYALTTLPIPKDDVIPVYGARGTEATCIGRLDPTRLKRYSELHTYCS